MTAPTSTTRPATANYTTLRGTTSFDYELTAVDADVAVVRGWTSYPSATDKSRRYDNLMVVRLAADGRARSFTDWWVIPGDAEPDA